MDGTRGSGADVVPGADKEDDSEAVEPEEVVAEAFSSDVVEKIRSGKEGAARYWRFVLGETESMLGRKVSSRASMSGLRRSEQCEHCNQKVIDTKFAAQDAKDAQVITGGEQRRSLLVLGSSAKTGLVL